MKTLAMNKRCKILKSSDKLERSGSRIKNKAR